MGLKTKCFVFVRKLLYGKWKIDFFYAKCCVVYQRRYIHLMGKLLLCVQGWSVVTWEDTVIGWLDSSLLYLLGEINKTRLISILSKPINIFFFCAFCHLLCLYFCKAPPQSNFNSKFSHIKQTWLNIDPINTEIFKFLPYVDFFKDF